LLEMLGRVPSPNENRDWYYAEQTSWWGKRLDPQTFWNNRVVWLDHSASFAARSRGRGYPPIPYDVPSYSKVSDDDIIPDEYWQGPELWMPKRVYTQRERSFWNSFPKKHPRPPDNIKLWLKDNADSWLRTKYRIENDPDYVKKFKVRPGRLENDLFSVLDKAKTSWYPPESVTPEAYQWDHVLRKRVEYENLIVSGDVENKREMDKFFREVYVDHTLITEPLTQEQINAANAWKVKYLNRLRSEQWDESYINAYLQAWDLTEEYVFESSLEE